MRPGQRHGVKRTNFNFRTTTETLNEKALRMTDYANLQKRVRDYERVLANVQQYRNVWTDSLKDTIARKIEQMIKTTKLDAMVEKKEQFGNLESVVCALGKSASGIFARVDEDTNKPLIKDFGNLVYQQLFNGKIQVMVILPFIEGLGRPLPPKTLGIFRPEELTDGLFAGHMEEFLRMVTEWEDYDDDEPSKIGFQHPPSLQMSGEEDEEDSKDGSDAQDPF